MGRREGAFEEGAEETIAEAMDEECFVTDISSDKYVL